MRFLADMNVHSEVVEWLTGQAPAITPGQAASCCVTIGVPGNG
jgi:hypothetical protein